MSAVTAVHRKAGFYTKYEPLNKSALHVFCQISKNIFHFFSLSAKGFSESGSVPAFK